MEHLHRLKVTAKPAAFDSDPNNHYVSKLSGNTGGRIGPSIILKVMAGDKVQINTYAYYTGATQAPVTDNTLLTDLLSTLVSGVTNQSGGKIGSGNSTALSNAVSPNVLSFLNNRTYNSSLPKAYLNWVLLDDQFKYVAGNMGALQVQSATSAQALVAPLQTMAKNGYLYVYLSNQSTQDVYFDNLIVTHTTGPLLQEQSYYPFGLQMSGISDKAMNKLDSKNKFNGGVELEEDYGVNLYSTFYRQYDPQLGRFTGIDALCEETSGLSVYHFSTNNPVSFNDPSGALFDHVTPTGEFMRNGTGWDNYYGVQWTYDGDNGAGGNGANYARSIDGGYEFGGIYAQAFLSGFQNAYNNPGPNDNFSFTAGQNKNGDIGYWALTTVQGASAGNGFLEEVKLKNNFFAFSNEQGYPIGFKQFIAITVGESGQKFNELETKAIGSSMINRINQAGTSLNDDDWLKRISYGGNTKTNFVATNGHNVDYNAVMGMTISKIIDIKNPIIQAAISSYNNSDTDYSNPNGLPDTGLYYWCATNGLKGSVYNSTGYVITLIAGGTTFFRPK